MTELEEITMIKDIIQSRCKTLNVKNSGGTAWGWLDICGSGTIWGKFTDEEKKALDELDIPHMNNFAYISPEYRKKIIKKHMEKKQ